jgi:serine/threonine-protein kinase
METPIEELSTGSLESQKSIDIQAGPTMTIEAPIEELTTGSIFAGRYKIVTELGRGGMGKVYRAIDQKIDEEIAADKQTIERFSNELKMARKIAHRNVCKMYYLDEEKGSLFITMEYVPGEDLKSMIRYPNVDRGSP